jgi:hypothetical protein
MSGQAANLPEYHGTLVKPCLRRRIEVAHRRCRSNPTTCTAIIRQHHDGFWANPAINFTTTLAGTTNGYGVLVVTGKLIGSSAFAWHGIILVVGDGEMSYQAAVS